jgi:HlyD family secretion protein
VLTGRILELPADFTLVNQQPVYRVPVSLDHSTLRLRNGYRGEIRKGMTLTARFVVAHRSLLQLLHDDVADWLDPGPDGAAPAAAAGER